MRQNEFNETLFYNYLYNVFVLFYGNNAHRDNYICSFRLFLRNYGLFCESFVLRKLIKPITLKNL